MRSLDFSVDGDVAGSGADVAGALSCDTGAATNAGSALPFTNACVAAGLGVCVTTAPRPPSAAPTGGDSRPDDGTGSGAAPELTAVVAPALLTDDGVAVTPLVDTLARRCPPPTAAFAPLLASVDTPGDADDSAGAVLVSRATLRLGFLRCDDCCDGDDDDDAVGDRPTWANAGDAGPPSRGAAAPRSGDSVAATPSLPAVAYTVSLTAVAAVDAAAVATPRPPTSSGCTGDTDCTPRASEAPLLARTAVATAAAGAAATRPPDCAASLTFDVGAVRGGGTSALPTMASKSAMSSSPS